MAAPPCTHSLAILLGTWQGAPRRGIRANTAARRNPASPTGQRSDGAPAFTRRWRHDWTRRRALERRLQADRPQHEPKEQREHEQHPGERQCPAYTLCARPFDASPTARACTTRSLASPPHASISRTPGSADRARSRRGAQSQPLSSHARPRAQHARAQAARRRQRATARPRQRSQPHASPGKRVILPAR